MPIDPMKVVNGGKSFLARAGRLPKQAVDDIYGGNHLLIASKEVLERSLKAIDRSLGERREVAHLQGKPTRLRVFRGVSRKVRHLAGEASTDYGWYGAGHYSSQERGRAEEYARGVDSIKHRYINITPRYVTKDEAARISGRFGRGVGWTDGHVMSQEFADDMLDQGYTGLVRLENAGQERDYLMKNGRGGVSAHRATIPGTKRKYLGDEIVGYLPEGKMIAAERKSIVNKKPGFDYSEIDYYDDDGRAITIKGTEWVRGSKGYTRRRRTKEMLVSGLTDKVMTSIDDRVRRNLDIMNGFVGEKKLKIKAVSVFNKHTMDFEYVSVDRLDDGKIVDGMIPVIDLIDSPTGSKIDLSTVRYYKPGSPSLRRVLKSRISSPRVRSQYDPLKRVDSEKQPMTVLAAKEQLGVLHDPSPSDSREMMRSYLAGSVVTPRGVQVVAKTPEGANALARIRLLAKPLTLRSTTLHHPEARDFMGNKRGGVMLKEALRGVLDRREAAEAAWKTRRLKYGKDGHR